MKQHFPTQTNYLAGIAAANSGSYNGSSYNFDTHSFVLATQSGIPAGIIYKVINSAVKNPESFASATYNIHENQKNYTPTHTEKSDSYSAAEKKPLYLQNSRNINICSTIILYYL